MSDKPGNLIIIFGTSQGLGKAFYEYAAQFAENEFLVVNRKPIESAHKKTLAVQMDLAKILKSDELASLFENIKGKNYQNVFLINNAGTIQPIKPVGRIEHKDIFKAFYVNYLNYAAIINAFIKSLGRLTVRKRIVNITSGSADVPQYGIALYCSAKAALEMLTMSVFKEQEILKQIEIVAIRPGAMDTAMQESIRRSSEQDFAAVVRSKQLFEDHRLFPPQDIAQLIYKVLFDDQYWSKPILDISEVI